MEHKYHAFLSYSHEADEVLASALQAELQRFSKPWHKLRVVRIFRDKASASASPELWPSLAHALDNSAHLILLASPQGAESSWVQRETSYWKERCSDRPLIVLRTAGRWEWDASGRDFDWRETDCVPANLSGYFQSEPDIDDLRHLRGRDPKQLRRDSALIDVVATLSATLQGRDKDDLIGEHVSQQRMMMRVAWSTSAILLLLLLGVIGLAFSAWRLSRLAEAERANAIDELVVRNLGNGMSRLAERNGRQDDESILAMPWFAEAFQQESRHPKWPERERVHRIRLGAFSRHVPRLVHQLFPGGPIVQAQLSKDGQRLMTVAETETGAIVRVFDVATGTSVGQPFGGDTQTPSAALSPDGSRLAMLSTIPAMSSFMPTLKSRLELWDVESGKRVAEVQELLDGNGTVAFSADGRRLLTQINSDENFLLRSFRERQTGEDAPTDLSPSVKTPTEESDIDPTTEKPDGENGGIEVSPEDLLSALMGDTEAIGSVRVWDAESLTPISQVLKHKELVTSAELSLDGSRVVTTDGEGVARIWDVQSGNAIEIGQGQRDDNNDYFVWATFDPHTNMVMTALGDGVITHWDINGPTQPLLSMRHSQSARLTKWAFFQDEAFATAGSFVVGSTRESGSEVIVWRANDGKDLTRESEQELRLPYDSEISYLSFAGKQPWLACAYQDGTIRVWSTRLQQPIIPTLRHSGTVTFAGFARNDRYLVTASTDGTVRIWELPRRVATESMSKGVVVSDQDFPRQVGTDERIFASSPDGALVAMGGDANDGHLAQIWDGAAGHRLLHEREPIEMAVFSPNGRWLVTASGRSSEAANEVQVWDVATGKPTATLEHNGSVHDIVFRPDGLWLATLGTKRSSDNNANAGEARIWDVRTWTLVGTIESTTPVRFVGYLGADRIIVSNFLNAEIWRIQKGKVDTIGAAAEGGLSPVATSYIANLWAVARDDGHVTVRDGENHPLAQAERIKHVKPMSLLLFAPRSRWLATGSNEEGTCRIWDLNTGNPKTSILRHDKITGAAFSADESLLVTWGEDGTVRVWDSERGFPVTPPLRHRLPTVLHAHFAADAENLWLFTYDKYTYYRWNLTPLRYHSPGSEVLATKVARLASSVELLSGHHIDAQRGEVPLDWLADEAVIDRVIEELPADSSDWTPFAQRARIRQKAERWEEAIADWDEAIRRSATDWECFLLQGNAYQGNKQRDHAIESYSKVLKYRPTDLMVRIRRAAAYLRTENTAKAIEDLSIVIDAAATSVNLSDEKIGDLATRLRAVGYLQRKEWDKAVADFEGNEPGREPSILNGAQGSAAYALALAYIGAGRDEDYQKWCLEMVQRFQNSTTPVDWYYVVLACVLASGPDVDETGVLDLAKRLVDSNDNQGAFHAAYGAALYRAGRNSESLEALQRAVSLSSESVKPEENYPLTYSWLFLAMAHQDAGHLRDARHWRTVASKAATPSISPFAIPDGVPDLYVMPVDHRLAWDILSREADKHFELSHGQIVPKP